MTQWPDGQPSPIGIVTMTVLKPMSLLTQLLMDRTDEDGQIDPVAN